MEALEGEALAVAVFVSRLDSLLKSLTPVRSYVSTKHYGHLENM